jgi:phosphoserine phosphatase
MEGTVFDVAGAMPEGLSSRSAWTLLAHGLGPLALQEDQANKARWSSGGYRGYSEWVIDTIRLHRRHGLRRQDFQSVIESVPYYAGVGACFAALREAGVVIAIVSGGVKALADRVALEHGLEHCYAAAEYFWAVDGSIRHWNVMPTDYSNKVGVVDLLLHDLGLEPDQCAFVGDGHNDAAVARYVGRSVAFNPHEELKACATHCVEQAPGQQDLSSVLPFLL